MADDPELEAIRSQRRAEMQYQVHFCSFLSKQFF